MVALPALVSGLDAELVRLGYKDSTMVWYRGCRRRSAPEGLCQCSAPHPAPTRPGGPALRIIRHCA